jgi:thioredoxin 2
MSIDSKHIVCPHCAGINRIFAGQDATAAKCGKCKKKLFTGKPADVDARKFDIHIRRNDIPVVVDFWAEWCGPCKMMAPAYEQVTAELEPNVRFLKVDTEAEQQLSARYSIRSIPTLMIFKEGKMVDQRAGAVDARTLRDWVKQHTGAVKAEA